ncbi:MAG: hypothetical protein ACLR2K_11575 [Paraclostridium sordellii]
MSVENCNEYLKNLEGKIVIFRMQQVYAFGKEPYKDLINIVKEIEIKDIELTKDSYLKINDTFVNLTPDVYFIREFNPDEMRFDCDGEKLSLTISFDVN